MVIHLEQKDIKKSSPHPFGMEYVVFWIKVHNRWVEIYTLINTMEVGQITDFAAWVEIEIPQVNVSDGLKGTMESLLNISKLFDKQGKLIHTLIMSGMKFTEQKIAVPETKGKPHTLMLFIDKSQVNLKLAL